MALKAEFDTEIKAGFDELDDIVINVTYLQITTSPYVAGGNVVTTESSYALRVIPLENTGDAQSTADDVDSVASSIMFIVSELPVDVDQKDAFIIGDFPCTFRL